MSWFDATGFANLAKTALKGAQKTIDKALDIKDEELNASESQTAGSSIDAFGDTFFNSWGVDEPAVKQEDRLGGEPPLAEASASALPKKLTSSTSLWGSFTGSFFENPKNTTEGESSSNSFKDSSPSRPTNLAADRKGAFRSLSLELPVHGSKVSGDPSTLLSPKDDAVKKGASSETQSGGSDKQKEEEEEKEGGVVSQRAEDDGGNSIRDEIRNYPAVEVVMRERKPRNYTNRLSAISSESDRRSSESCEVIGSLTPESERTASISTSSSVARLRQSGSFGSVEVLTSPSSVEVLGSTSSNTTSLDETGKERYSSDSISPVAEHECVEVIGELDEDEPSLAEDSYTSASESTLNTTVLECGHPPTAADRWLNRDCSALEDLSPRDGVLSRSSTILMQTSMNQSCSSLGGIEQVPLSLLGSDLGQTTPTTRLSESVSDIFRPITGDETISVEHPSSNSGSSVTLVAEDAGQPSGESGKLSVLASSGESGKLSVLASSGESGKLLVLASSGDSWKQDSEAALLSSCEEGTLMGSSCEGEEARMQESTTSTSSFLIKNMIADAMTEKAKEQSPMSSERCSDAKVGSSEHTSGDELETATSSDIEVISSPTPNGDSSSAASRQSPAKLHHDKTPKPRFGSWLTMAGRSSSEAYDPFSAKQKGHQRDHSGASSGGSDDSEVEKLHKKISEMKEIIETRESKLFDLSRANAELQEANADLRSQLESQDVSQMSEEFMQRLAALERKFQQAIREKEVLRKQLEYAKAAAAASEREAESEKDQVIAELREEGEKLSKQQLSLNNMIKKLRATEKDNQKSISSLKEQLEEASQEVERAKKSLSAKEEVERTQIEAVHQLTKSNQLLEKSSAKLQGQVDTLTSSVTTLQKELDESREECRQLSEEAARAVRSAEDGVRRRLEEELEAASAQQEQLEATVHDLRDKLSQALETNVQRESEWRRANDELLRRLEAAELRAEEAAHAAGACTQPLLRQIDALTAAASEATLKWDHQEKAHLNTIGQLELRLSQVEESERASREECARLAAANAGLQMKCTLAEQESAGLRANIATLTKHNASLSEQNARISDEFETENRKLQASVEEARREARALEQQLAVERAAVEAERRKNTVLHDALRTRGASNTSPQTASPRSSPTLSFGRVSVSESLASAAWPTLGEDAFESASTSGRLGFENIRPENNTSFIESLQAHLKLRDGEVQQMQWELARGDSERSALRDELATVTAKSEEQAVQLAALATQYDALLQMYGEKMEESQELRMDLQDVKDMYKAQIDQLLKKEANVNT